MYEYEQHRVDPLREKWSNISGTKISKPNLTLDAKVDDLDILVLGYTEYYNCFTNNWEESMYNAKYPYHLLLGDTKTPAIKAYLEYLEDEPEESKTVYILTDSHESFGMGRPEEAIDAIHKLGKPLIFSTEIWQSETGNSYPDRYWQYHEDPPNGNIYINSGLMAGTRNALIDILHFVIQDRREHVSNHSISKDKWTEHTAYTKYINDNSQRVILDTEGILFANSVYSLTKNNVSRFEWNGERLTYDNGNRTVCPCFVQTPCRYVDSLQRYNNYGQLLLCGKFESKAGDLFQPRLFTVLIIIIIVLVVLLFIIGFHFWILAAIAIILFAIVISYKTIDPT